MSTSIAILTILSAYPEGLASFQSLKADLAVLSTNEWLGRMKALARQSGPVNLFSDGLAIRDRDGWMITQAGRDFLAVLGNEDFQMPRITTRPKLRVISTTSSIPKDNASPRDSRRDVVAPDRAAG
jgi:hypothetical protein